MEKVAALVSSLSLLLSSHLPKTLPFIDTKKAVVCIDPGHGGDDPGAMYQDLTEAEVTLSIAQKLQSLLTENNYDVVMTRTTNDTTLSNSDRAATCNENHANMLLSIHLNANTDSSVDYTQGLYGIAEKDKALTTSLHDTLANTLNLPTPGEDTVTDFADNTLLKATMPATLQETLFITSGTEYDGLKNGSREDDIAKALFKGITSYLNEKGITAK